MSSDENNWACFSHDTAYSDSEYLAKRTVSDKILQDRSYEIAINVKYDGFQRVLGSIVYNFFEKKLGAETKVSANEELAQESHEPVFQKFKRKKVYVRFNDNIWVADLAEMGSLSSKNQGLKYS